MACFELKKAQAQSLTQTLKLPLIDGGLKPPIYDSSRTSQISHLHGKGPISTPICTTPWPMLEVPNDSPLGPPAQWRVINHSAGVSARLISCSGHGIDPRVLTAAPEQVRPDLADLVTDSASSKARCLRSRTTEAEGCLAYRDTVPTADARQGQKLCGAIPHVAKSFMLVWNLKTLQILFIYNDVCRLCGN